MTLENLHQLRLLSCLVITFCFATWLFTISNSTFASGQPPATQSRNEINGLIVSDAVAGERIRALESRENQHDLEIKDLRDGYSEIKGVGGAIAVVVGILAALGLIKPARPVAKPNP